MPTDPKRDDVLRALAARAGEIPALTRRLVEVNSHTDNVAGTNRVGELLAEALALPSLALTTAASDRYGDHLIWKTPAARAPNAHPIVLIGHHDTVFPAGTFEGWRERDGRAHGPGAFDMKGGLAIIATALAALEDCGALAALPIVVISVSDEEVGSPDSAPHVREAARGAACGLVFESGRPGDQLVTRRKAFCVFTATATGRAAHAGNAHREGKSAIWALARFIDHAQRITDYERGVTVNAGTVRGGTTRNTVAAEAVCELDGRFERAADEAVVVGGVRAAAEAASREVEGTRVEVAGGVLRPPLERTEATAALVAEYVACQRAAGLGGGEAPLAGGGSDANTVGAMGIPVIDALGPRGAHYHTHDEYIELDSLAPKAEALVRFLCSRRS
jgi:glutamate carboxypeptidase